MVRMFFANIFDSKVVNYETELYGPPRVFPYSRGGNSLEVADLLEAFT